MEQYEPCPHFLALLRTVTHGQAVLLLTEWFYTVGWWTAADTPVSLARSETDDIGSLPTGRAYKGEHGVYLTWMAGSYVIENALHPHTNTCYIQSGPHLASAFLMWMHCSDLGKHFECCWAQIAPHTDIKALLRQALYGMFCQMVPFPSSSHFLVLLQPLENANPFIRLCVN